MKTIYKSLRNISLALCATMAISSCDSFLDTKPYDFVPAPLLPLLLLQLRT